MSKVVALSRQYVVGSAIFDSVTFREPKLSDYRALGKAFEIQRGVFVTYPDAVWGYADRLVEGVPPGALGELELTDAISVEEAVVGFFTDATKQLRKRENSSSGSDGDQAMSTG